LVEVEVRDQHPGWLCSSHSGVDQDVDDCLVSDVQVAAAADAAGREQASMNRRSGTLIVVTVGTSGYRVARQRS